MSIGIPEVESFVEQVDRRYSRHRPETLWGLEDELRALAVAGLESRIVNAYLRKMGEAPNDKGDWLANQLILHRGAGYTFSIWLFTETRQYAHTQAGLALFAPLSDAPLHCVAYELPPEYRNELFDPRIQLQEVEQFHLSRGDVLRAGGDRRVHDFRITAPVATLKLVTEAQQPMEWLFNKSTGFAWQANDSELTATQLRVAAYVLGRLAEPSSTEVLERLSEHPHHAVRWAAIQGLGRINRSTAIKCLKRATLDSHPHIQRAAARTLAQIEGSS